LPSLSAWPCVTLLLLEEEEEEQEQEQEQEQIPSMGMPPNGGISLRIQAGRGC